MEKKRNDEKKRMEVSGSIRIQLLPVVGVPAKMFTEAKHQKKEM